MSGQKNRMQEVTENSTAKSDLGDNGKQFLNPKFTLDVSFLLATVIAGAAVVEGISQYAKNRNADNLFDLILLAQALTVVLTTLRFFNGNVLWNYLNYRTSSRYKDLAPAQRAFQRLSSYYIHIFQYVLFYLAASEISKPVELLIMMMILSGTDVIWTFGGWKHTTSRILKRALASWCIINLFSLIGCFVFYKTMEEPEIISYSLFGLYVVAGLADYLSNITLYFGYTSTDNKS